MTPFWRGFLTGLALGPVWRWLTERMYGAVVVTATESGECVAVTRQDDEGRVMSIIWAKDSPSNVELNGAPLAARPSDRRERF